MSAFIITRIQVGDYDTWRPMFDHDRPQAREKAKLQRIFRGTDDPNHVFVFLEFASEDDANEARRVSWSRAFSTASRTNTGRTLFARPR